MSTDQILVTGGGLLLIAALWYYFFGPKKVTEATVEGNAQEVHITVQPETAAAKAEYKEQTYYFCAEDCKQKFAGDPERYLTAHYRRSPG